MQDEQGYRLNIGIMLVNGDKKLFWGKRAGCENAWQFPQGGMRPYETLEEAMYRELMEEIGLGPDDVMVLQKTRRWVFYKLPPRNVPAKSGYKPCIGQRQRWFLLKLISDEKTICFDKTSTPEFSDWQWVDYWYPLEHVVEFKREVYQKVLSEFEGILF